ncbi:MAG: flagellar basal body P-ring formation chaperone FlgA [Candidatus Kapaibacterium sp.]
MKNMIYIALLILAFSPVLAAEGISTFSAERLRQACIGYLEKRADNIEVEIVSAVNDVKLEASPVTAGFNCDKPEGLSKVIISFYHNDKVIHTENIQVNIRRFGIVPVSNYNIASGKELSSSDFTMKRTDITGISQTDLPDLSKLDGRTAKYNIPAGKLLTKRMLEAEVLVKRGEPVEIIAISGKVSIKTFGTALADASPGENVRVKREGFGNPVLFGTAGEDGRVYVIRNSGNYSLKNKEQ